MSRRVESSYRRRDLLQGGGATIAGYISLSKGIDISRAQSSEPAIRFNDQHSDGESVVITSAQTSVESRLIIISNEKNEQGYNTSYREVQLDPGTEFSSRTLELDNIIEETRAIRAEIRTVDGNDELLARSVATVAVNEPLPPSSETRLIEANPDAGFNYPYYLYIPDEIRDGDVPLLVEPNNTGTSTDDFEQHRSRAEDLVKKGYPRYIANALNVPLLVPVFPRPRSEPVDWRHYTHQLDRETLQIGEGPLKRIDLQLLSMVDDARKKELADKDASFRKEIMLNGYSASGTFSDRFTVLHADRILSVTAGGLNGMTLLPLEQVNDQTLRYHIGIADVESLTGDTVDLDALNETNQFLYLGANDDNDTIPYDDAWTSDDLRETALEVYGEDMQEDRFPFSQSAYDQQDIQAQFRLYEELGHRYPQVEDLIEFHRRSIVGEDVSKFGSDVADGASGMVVTDGPTAELEIENTEITTGDTVSFEASNSQRGDTTISKYSWELGDGAVKTGELVTHYYTEPGTYTVKLTVEDFFGETSSITTEVTVTSSATSESETTGGSGPGIGFGATLTAVGSAAYLVSRRSSSE